MGVSKTGYLIKDRLWLWDDENDMLIAVLQRSNKKVLYKSPYIRLAEKRMGITLNELLKRFLMGTHSRQLKCPRCDKEELSRKEGIVNGKRVVVVIFKCFFSATFEEGLTDQEMQKRLDEFEKSGKM